jgi:hypothetical protein
MSEEEFLKHLYSKENPTDEDIEAAERISHMMESIEGTMELIHSLTIRALAGEQETLKTIHDITAPAQVPEGARLQ